MRIQNMSSVLVANEAATFTTTTNTFDAAEHQLCIWDKKCNKIF